LLILALLPLLFAGCSTIPPRNAAPDDVYAQVEIAGIPDARFWGDKAPPRAEQRIEDRSRDELMAKFPAMFGKTHNYLAISGGGADGAFGAGLLVGWTEAGGRPEFQIVTGVSTGALIAPFAFLGPGYDEVLREVYTTISTKDILRRRWLGAIFFEGAAADSTPLLNMIRKFVDDDVVRAIAAEHRKGRRLFIGTTPVDEMRPMIWDIGAIAISGHPDANDLIHRIMLASASIPGAFPPVKINVQANAVTYDEFHVDGGTTNQVFVYPPALNWRQYLDVLEVPGKMNIYVIRNSPLERERQVIEPAILPIAKQSISSLIRTQGIGDLNLIYLQSRRDGGHFKLAYIPDDFNVKPKELFDNAYMNELFDLGYERAKAGYPWLDRPPGWFAD
jgi:predicted acylesterase/phospholipase RssA